MPSYSLTYLDLIPAVLIRTLGDELSLARSLAVSLASFQSTPSVSRSSFSVSRHVLFGPLTLLLPPSGLHIMARLAGLVVASYRMCPTNRLLLVATVDSDDKLWFNILRPVTVMIEQLCVTVLYIVVCLCNM